MDKKPFPSSKLEAPVCPKCLCLASRTFCRGGCYDGNLSPLGTGTEHLHWKCCCGYEWMSLCADAQAPEDGK